MVNDKFGNTTAAFISEYRHDDCGRLHHSCCICPSTVLQTRRFGRSKLSSLGPGKYSPHLPAAKLDFSKRGSRWLNMVGCDCVYVRTYTCTYVCHSLLWSCGAGNNDSCSTYISFPFLTPSLPHYSLTHSLTHSLACTSLLCSNFQKPLVDRSSLPPISLPAPNSYEVGIAAIHR